MLGSMFAGTEETPGEIVQKPVVLPDQQRSVKVPFKVLRGMASIQAIRDRLDVEDDDDDRPRSPRRGRHRGQRAGARIGAADHPGHPQAPLLVDQLRRRRAAWRNCAQKFREDPMRYLVKLSASSKRESYEAVKTDPSSRDHPPEDMAVDAGIGSELVAVREMLKAIREQQRMRRLAAGDGSPPPQCAVKLPRLGFLGNRIASSTIRPSTARRTPTIAAAAESSSATSPARSRRRRSLTGRTAQRPAWPRRPTQSGRESRSTASSRVSSLAQPTVCTA